MFTCTISHEEEEQVVLSIFYKTASLEVEISPENIKCIKNYKKNQPFWYSSGCRGFSVTLTETIAEMSIDSHGNGEGGYMVLKTSDPADIESFRNVLDLWSDTV